MTPIFSVVIPVYNRANIISRTLDSVFSQSFKNFEIVVVDDASTDDIGESLKYYIDKIVYVRNEKNSNGAVSRNRGVEAAKGEYVAFLDSDDFWHPDKLWEMHKHIESNCNKESTVFFHSLFYCDKKNLGYSRILPTVGYKGQAIIDYLLIERGLIQTSCIVGLRSIFLKNPFDFSLRKHQDWDLCIALDANGISFSFVDEPLTYWDQTSANRTSFSSLENSRIWQNKMKDRFSKKQMLAFEAKVILPVEMASGITWKKFTILIFSYLEGILSLREFLGIVTNSKTISWAKEYLKRFT